MKFRRVDHLHKRAFTLIELMIVMVLLLLIVGFAYKVFFAQTKVVSQSLEYLKVNESFRNVMLFLGDDIKEATNIIDPIPIYTKNIEKLITKPGIVLHLVNNEVDPSISFDSPLGGQISNRTEIVYEIEKYVNPNAKMIPRYRLIRTEIIQDKPGGDTKQRKVLMDNLREFSVFRTVRRPFRPSNISSLKDKIIQPRPLSESGTGNSLVHVRMTIERTRKFEKGDVYQISMTSSFYKRGKEVFVNQ